MNLISYFFLGAIYPAELVIDSAVGNEVILKKMVFGFCEHSSNSYLHFFTTFVSVWFTSFHWRKYNPDQPPTYVACSVAEENMILIWE